MALISKPDTTGVNIKKDLSSLENKKRRKRTLVKQQQMSEKIYNLSNEFLSKTQEGVSAIEELKSAMEQIVAASEQNAGAAEESLNAIKQINNNIENIVNETNHIISNTQQALEVFYNSNNSVLETKQRMEEAQKTFLNIVNKAEDLKKAGDSIGESVEVISKVADKTNLLALNAAIEAARAKEYGKGFAVVADETRSLASTTAKDAEDTSNVVANIQKSIDKAKKSVEITNSFIERSAINTNKIASISENTIEIAKKLADVMNKLEKKVTSVLETVNNMQKGVGVISNIAEKQANIIGHITNIVEMQVEAFNKNEDIANYVVELAEDLKNSTDATKEAQEFASIAEELSNSIENIKKSMNEVVLALTQIEKEAEIANNDAIKNIEYAQESISNVAIVAKKLDKSVEYNKTIISSTKEMIKLVESMIDNINSGIKEGANMTKELSVINKHSKFISKILRKNENIVIQVTMLAVSGSIEAARAGEFGKGFAVVSSDVRDLAQEAQGNLEKIFDIVVDFNEEIAIISNNWSNAIEVQQKEGKNSKILKLKLEEVVNRMKKLESVLEELKHKNSQNLESLKESLQGVDQIQQAIELTMSNASQSKEAANLILSVVEDMGNLVEELAVVADELQQG